MVVIMEAGAAEAQIEGVIAWLNAHGFDVHRSSGAERTVLGAIGVRPGFDSARVQALDGVAEVHRVTELVRLASRTRHREDTVVAVGGAPVGGPAVVLGAIVEAFGEAEGMEAAMARTAAHGAAVVRAGPRSTQTAPYGVEEIAEPVLHRLRTAATTHGLGLVVEVAEAEAVARFADRADAFAVGARSMQHARLLRTLGEAGLPVVLDRAPGAPVEAWLLAADFILSHGNPHVILCERGPDLDAVVVAKRKSHLPVFVEPGGGPGTHVLPLARAAVAAGADGLAVALAVKEGGAAALAALAGPVRAVAEAVGRPLWAPRGTPQAGAGGAP
ncbi:MAG: 3-deoxy-7-phosphoheptulonate synthase [Rhodothermales bacterium]|nr:3-deoxy-7-phosphoheptulonate synthase [Rhodothermales bacterium]